MPEIPPITPDLIPQPEQLLTSADPVSAVANAAQVMFHFITATLPSQPQRLAAFKLRNPAIYAHIRMRIYRQLLTHLRFHWHEDITTYIRLMAGAFTVDEQNYMITLAQEDLKRK